jgi:coat protein B
MLLMNGWNSVHVVSIVVSHDLVMKLWQILVVMIVVIVFLKKLNNEYILWTEFNVNKVMSFVSGAISHHFLGVLKMFNKVINAAKRCYEVTKQKTVDLWNRISGKQIAVGSGLMIVAGSSHAAVDAAITTAITTAGTDVGTVGGAVFAVLVAAAAFKWLRRAL